MKAKKPFGLYLGRVVAWTLAGLCVIAGITQFVVQPIQRFTAKQSAVVEAAPALPDDTARAIAGQFATDYLTYNPLAPSTGKAALAAGLAPDTDAARLTWSGTGWIAADVVIPGAVTAVTADQVVVAVQARVQLAAPNGGQLEAPAKAAEPLPGRPANVTTVPGGYSARGALWVTLQVPVNRLDTGAVVVDGAGPVFASDPFTPPTAGTEGDPNATAATKTWAQTLFDAYAGAKQTSIDYLTAPDHHITPLAGAVTMAELVSWQLRGEQDGQRTGTARVAWSFQPNLDLNTTQNYSVTAIKDETRWFTTGIGPAVSIPTTTQGAEK